MKLLNGEDFKSCEIVSGSHFMVMKRDGSAAVQAGQRMRDVWNLSTVGDGWGRSTLMSDETIASDEFVQIHASISHPGIAYSPFISGLH